MKPDRIASIPRAVTPAGRALNSLPTRRRFVVLFAGVLLAASPLASVLAAEGARPPRLFMIGDSTMADMKLDKGDGMRGWGQLLPEFFTDPSTVANHAVSGRSTKSFIDEGRWAKVIAQINRGDFLLIQFAHNDEKSDKPVHYAAAAGAFRENLRRYIRETRAKGATPLLATPVARRRWNAAGVLVDTHGDYPAATREVAAQEGVPLLELTRATEALIRRHGVEDSKRLFTWIAPGTNDKFPAGVQDDTHFSAYGARAVAALATAEIRRLNLPLAAALKPSQPE